MKLTLKRRIKEPEYTIGTLYIDNTQFSDTLEDRDRGLSDSQTGADIKNIKVYGQTAIPTGTYTIDMNTVSSKFKDRSWAIPYQGKIPRLLNVKGFTGVLIHPLNTAEESLGCIGVGVNSQKGKITNSTTYFHNLMKQLVAANNNNEVITITII